MIQFGLMNDGESVNDRKNQEQGTNPMRITLSDHVYIYQCSSVVRNAVEVGM